MKEKSKRFSIVDKGLIVDGNIEGEGELLIKGMIKGKLSANIVVIAEEGAVFADTKAASVTIGGNFEGNIDVTDNLILLPTGRLKGVVTCKNLTVESGAILDATIQCGMTDKVLPFSEKKEIPVPPKKK